MIAPLKTKKERTVYQGGFAEAGCRPPAAPRMPVMAELGTMFGKRR